MGDVKAYLRKIDFPDVVPDALSHMQKLWLPDGTTQQLLLMKELSQEFVFFEVDQWGNDKEKMTYIKELAVIVRFLYFFEQEGPDSKLATFIFLFPHGTTLLNKRLPFLNRLVSIAVAGRVCNLLTYIGIWMQVNGCSSENSHYIAEYFCQEHFKAKGELSEAVKELPIVSPLFCASITSALATLYLNVCPLKRLIEVINTWLTIAPMYCFEPLKIRIPSSFNFSGPQTPLSHIMHWVVISPFYKLTPEWNNSENLFSSLHSALLSVVVHGSKVTEVRLWEAIPVNKVQLIVETLNTIQNPKPEHMAISLGRLAQCLEAGLANNCIHSVGQTLGDLFIMCIKLPFHQLLKIVLQKWSHELDRRRNLN